MMSSKPNYLTRSHLQMPLHWELTIFGGDTNIQSEIVHFPIYFHLPQVLRMISFVVALQLPSHVWLFATPWTAARQASLSFTLSQSLLKLISIELVLPSNHLILCCPLLLPSSVPALESFLMSWLFASGGQSIRASASASVFPMNIQDWFPLGLTGLFSLQSKGLSRVFANTTVWKHQFSGSQPSLWSNSHICTWLLEKP